MTERFGVKGGNIMGDVTTSAPELGPCHAFRIEFAYRHEPEIPMLEGAVENVFRMVVHEARVNIAKTVEKLKESGLHIVLCDLDGNPLGEDE